MRITALLFGLLMLTTMAVAQTSPFSHGASDRAGWEAWIDSLGVEGKDGATFWADQRSRPAPQACDQPNKSEYWLKGCNEAQKRLAESDAQRKADPLYRRGWNSYQVAGTTTDAAPGTPAPPATAVLSSAWDSLTKQVPQLASAAVGLPLAQIRAEYPAVDCSNHYCEFSEGLIPGKFCPPEAACTKLVLVHDDKTIMGWMADLALDDWRKMMTLTKNGLGKPIEHEIAPHGLLTIRSHYWTWTLSGGLDVTFTQTTGQNLYGARVDSHNIMVVPGEPGPKSIPVVAATGAAKPAVAIPPPPQLAKPWAPDPSDPRVATAAQDCDAYRMFNTPAYRNAPPAYRDSLAQCQQDKSAARAALDGDKSRYDAEQQEVRRRQMEARQAAMEKSPENKCRDPINARTIMIQLNSKLKRDEVIDIQHMVTISQDRTDPDVYSCHGVFVFASGAHLPLTFTWRRNIADDLISTWTMEYGSVHGTDVTH